MVKRLPNWLKIGLQSWFGPNFIVEFEAFFQKKLAWPTTQCIGSVDLGKKFTEKNALAVTIPGTGMSADRKA